MEGILLKMKNIKKNLHYQSTTGINQTPSTLKILNKSNYSQDWIIFLKNFRIISAKKETKLSQGSLKPCLSLILLKERVLGSIKNSGMKKATTTIKKNLQSIIVFLILNSKLIIVLQGKVKS